LSARGTRPFAALSPDAVLEAVESLGVRCDGRQFALNSYENRVYQLGTETHGTLVAKFYRPARWSDAQILEEHAFTTELAGAELPVAAPLSFAGRTLHEAAGIRFALFPQLAGRAPETEAAGALELIGRTIGRIHAVGAAGRFSARPALTVDRLGVRARERLLASALLDASLRARYEEASAQLLAAIEDALDFAGPARRLRIHGDCHLGNLLWTAQGPAFVDLDDCTTGPAIQDLWMFLSGSPDERAGQWQRLAGGYREFHGLDDGEIALIEPLRGLRMIHHSAWIAERWDDPAFPRAFPWFTSPRFWEEHVSDLWQQIDAIAQPPLTAP
jgi:Ser/Thr protein kinase RdoA (MazF antagonist)